MTFPQSRNGYVDDGTPIRASNQLKHCPNCGSDSYQEYVSTDRCDACDLRCDYWGNGANHVYQRMIDQQHALQQIQEEQEESTWRNEDSPW
jgi:uncharacterized protein (DUF983 family)